MILIVNTIDTQKVLDIKNYKYTNSQKDTIHVVWNTFHWFGEDTDFEQLSELKSFRLIYGDKL